MRVEKFDSAESGSLKTRQQEDRAIQWTWTDATGETVWRRTYDTSTGVTVDYPWGDNAKAFTTTPSLSGDQFTLETKDGNGMVDDVQTLADGAPHGGSFTGAGVSQSWNATTNNYGEATSVASMLGGSAGPTETYSKFGLPETISGVAGMATTTFSAWVNPFTSTGILNLSTMTNGHTSRWRTSPMGWPLTTGGYGEPWVNLQPPSFGSGISQSFSVNSASGTSQTLDYNPGSTMQERVFADGKTESFGYTDGGAAKSWTTPGGSTQNFWPNAYGQSTRQGSLAWKIGYDLAGRLSTVTDAAGTHGYKYYEGQLDTEWHSGGPNNGGWVWHGYDSAGRLKTVKLSDGSSCSYTYNTDGTLDTVTTVGGSTGTWSSYDAATGRAQSFAIGSMTVSSGYDLNGHPTSAVSAAGGYTSTYSYTYNGDGNCSSVTAPDGSWNIGYDSYGNLYSASSNVGGTNYTYSWDAAGRPSGASSYLSGTRTNSSSVVVAGSVTPGATVTINGSAVTPDANGGFSLTNSDPSIQNTWQTYTVQAMLAGAGNNGTAAVAQQVKKVFVPPTTETLGSDGNDNRASDARWTYSWNDYGQLTDANDAKSGGNTDIAFTYDYMGRMVQRVKSVSGAVVSTTTTLYDGWKPALQIDYGSTGGETARRIYTWGPDVSGAIDGAAGIGGLIEMVERKGGVTTKSLALNDGIGNVVGMVDESNGSRLATYSYGPFGEPVSATGPKMADCPLRWQTKLYDEDLGLCYFGKRWYDPKTRTWISPDPLREGGGVNVAEAFRNQPLNYVDPTGGKPIPMIGDDLRRAQEQGGFFGLMGATPAAIWNLMNPFDPTSPASTGRQKFSSEILPQGLANLDAMNMPSFLKTVIKANIGLGIAGNNFNPLNGAVGLYDAGTTVVRIGPVAAGKQLIKSIHDQPAVFAGGLPLIFIGGEESLVAESLEDASTAGEVVETAPTEFQIIQYGDKAFGFQNHHGVMDKWATENVPGYASRDSYGPSIRLSIANHNATRTVFTDFSKKLTGKPVGKIDWQGMSPQTAQELSERMFDAANVPAEARAAYYRAFNRYIYTGEW